MFKLTLPRMLIASVVITVVLFCGGLRKIYGLFVDPSAQPVCHKGVHFLLTSWQDTHKTREFPNVDGDSAKSIAELDPRNFEPNLKVHYSYVPGLTKDDPGDLVLLYVNQPTRWTWHGQPPTIFTDHAWILVPVDMKLFGGRERDQLGPGEFSERVSFDEFRQRLEKTLDFLKTQRRPNWEAVVKEHSEFLKRVTPAQKQ